eukprot:6192037-Pleurochrysis_carterae.AAC.1
MASRVASRSRGGNHSGDTSRSPARRLCDSGMALLASEHAWPSALSLIRPWPPRICVKRWHRATSVYSYALPSSLQSKGIWASLTPACMVACFACSERSEVGKVGRSSIITRALKSA